MKESYRDIERQIGTNHKSIVKWVALYNEHSPDDLKLRYTNYPAHFKIDIPRFMQSW
jgi:hypothetical protein